MIAKTQTKQIRFEEEHHPALQESLSFGGKRWGKWWTTQEPLLRYVSPVSEWGRPAIGVRIESWSRSPASDHELFEQAAAKVNYKIQIDRKILGGAPCVAGTRVPVYAILQLIESGYSHRRVLKSFPSLSQEGLEAALRFSAFVMER